ncbi:MAG: 5-formyltetrahydrofolate cyclo-ligase [Microcoleaceae cyanobacterium]
MDMTNPSIPSSKSELRRSLLKLRRDLPSLTWQAKSELLCHHLNNSSPFQEARTILAYMSFRQEPDLSFLWQVSHLDNPKIWGFPRCVGSSLVWHRWQFGDSLKTGRFGIREPAHTAPQLAPEEVDLILIPAVACDQYGYRLGYGGGFYDRMLSQPEWQGILRIGITFDCTYVPRLPIDSWDQPLEGVCTEKQLILF